jgi:hypothetical protein
MPARELRGGDACEERGGGHATRVHRPPRLVERDHDHQTRRVRGHDADEPRREAVRRVLPARGVELLCGARLARDPHAFQRGAPAGALRADDALEHREHTVRRLARDHTLGRPRLDRLPLATG